MWWVDCESVFVVDVLVTVSDRLYPCGGWMVVIRFVVDVLVTVSDKLYPCGGWMVVTGSDKLYPCGGWMVVIRFVWARCIRVVGGWW